MVLAGCHWQNVITINHTDKTGFLALQKLLNYHTARAVLDWLEDRVAALEEEGTTGMYEADLDIEQ